MPRSRRPQSQRQRTYNTRRHWAAVNRGNKPLLGCLLPLVLLGVICIDLVRTCRHAGPSSQGHPGSGPSTDRFSESTNPSPSNPAKRAVVHRAPAGTRGLRAPDAQGDACPATIAEHIVRLSVEGVGGGVVSLINTNGLVLIGPGSEWFWTALSGLVLAITFFAIYRQLRLQRSQAAIAQVTAIRAEWTSKAERHARLAALIDLEHRVPAEGMPQSAYAVANWFDRQGYLVRKGHLDLEEASSIFTDDLLFWWTTCEPYVRQDRATHELDQILADFEGFAKAVG